MTDRFSATPTLQGLKDFQQATVEHAFARLYLDQNPTRRFLVADEVGLGKTLVAKGIIAKTIEHLQGQVKRLDVVYICSNADIATQNIARLNVSKQKVFAKATRLTLLPQEVQELERQDLNFISFTPGTTFNMGNRSGHKAERRLLYYVLIHRRRYRFRRGLQNLLQLPIRTLEAWQDYLAYRPTIDRSIADEFRQRLRQDERLSSELEQLAEHYYDRRRSTAGEISQRRLALIGALRKLVAQCSLEALEPDLIILDEFQRFRDLLDENDPAAELATDLFNYEGVAGEPASRVLLLSATPYKMYVTDDEEEDHYQDFRATLKFLANGQADILATAEHDLQQLRVGMLTNRPEEQAVEFGQARDRLQRNLMRLMCRTERVGRTLHQDAMLAGCQQTPDLIVDDLAQLRALTEIGEHLGAGNLVEYWKSAPYLLNFMKGYQLKKLFDAARADNPALQSTIRAHGKRFFPIGNVQQLKKIDAGNAKLRTLVAEIEQQQLWRLLWMPPSLPYWRPSGPYKRVGSVSKQLIFSSWNVVPDTIAAMTSYAVHRQMLRQNKRVSYEHMSELPQLLTYSRRDDGAPTAMSAFALFFPSPALLALLDPIQFSAANGNEQTLTRQQARKATKQVLRPLIDDLPIAARREASERGWFSQFVASLTARDTPGVDEWCRGGMGLFATGEEGSRLGLQAHQRTFADYLDSDAEVLPKPPSGYENTLADLTLAGPGVCALRALQRAAPELAWSEPALLSAAAQVAEGIHGLFNGPEVTAMLQSDQHKNESYWRRVLRYCVDGNLQSVLDEHVHILSESLGIADKPGGERVTLIATEIHEALSLRMTRVRADSVGDGTQSDINIRCRYAVRYGDTADDESSGPNRKESVRVAFNSPFRPFILASTSVGQEGLDFHQWCHSVIHWNLPSNPVDLEQREGRVHRYKGYAVRKNVARHCCAAHRDEIPPFTDVWRALFERAAQDRDDNADDITPYWIFETPGGDKVLRRLLNQPLSADASRYDSLQRSLALYRMAFGQPRQEDLIRHLETRYSPEEAKRIARAWRISLAPGADL